MKKTHIDELDDMSLNKLGKAILVYIAGSNFDLGYVTILYAIVKILTTLTNLVFTYYLGLLRLVSKIKS